MNRAPAIIPENFTSLTFHSLGLPIKRLQVCEGIPQPNEKLSQQMITYSKEKASTERLIYMRTMTTGKKLTKL